MHSGGTANNSANSGQGGGLSFVDLDNESTAAIAPGAQVNQNATPLATQNVTLAANATLAAMGLAGLDLEFSYASGTKSAVDAFVNVLSGNNEAHAYIGDRATVSVDDDVTITSVTNTDVILVTEQGGQPSVGGLAVDGAFGMINVNAESLAYIEDSASVTAGDDVLLDADS